MWCILFKEGQIFLSLLVMIFPFCIRIPMNYGCVMLCVIVDRKQFEIIKQHSFDICLYVYGWCLSLESTDTSYWAVWGSTGWVSRDRGKRWTAGIPVWDQRGRCGGPAPKGGSSAPDRGVYLVISVSHTNEHFRTNKELVWLIGP